MTINTNTPTPTTRDEAERVAERFLPYLLRVDRGEKLIDAIDKALQARDERAARIADQWPTVTLVIITTIIPVVTLEPEWLLPPRSGKVETPMSDNRFADNLRDNKGRILYLLGDVVTIPFESYPGPVPSPVAAKVIKVHSPTYYEFEWVDKQGKVKRRSLIRSQLP
jgi:hypothetical protein